MLEVLHKHQVLYQVVDLHHGNLTCNTAYILGCLIIKINDALYVVTYIFNEK